MVAASASSLRSPLTCPPLLAGVCEHLSNVHELAEALTTALLLCAYDVSLKVEITRRILPLYHELADPDLLEGRAHLGRCLDRLTVHLWLLPGVVDRCVVEDRLLDTLLGVLVGHLEKHTADPGETDASRPQLPWGPVFPGTFSERGRNMHRMLSDCRLVLCHPEVRRLVLRGRRDLISGPVCRARELAQGCLFLTRKQGEHVEYESSDWLAACIIEENLHTHIIHPLLGLTDIQAPSSEPDVQPEDLLWAANEVLEAAARCPTVLADDRSSRPAVGSSYEDLIESRVAATMHIPLPRGGVSLLLESMRMKGARDAEEWSQFVLGAGLDADRLRDLGRLAGQEAIRVLALMSQLRARLWVLNGEPAWQMEYIYRSVYMSEDTLCNDIEAARVSVTMSLELQVPLLLDASIFLPQLWFGAASDMSAALSEFLSAFGAHSLLEDEMPALLEPLAADDKQLACITDGLRWLVALLRLGTGRLEGPRKQLRRQLVQNLAVQDLPHSGLLDKMPGRLGEDEALVDEVLLAVARCVAPLGQAVGAAQVYTLKDEAWAEVDPLWPLYSGNQRQASVPPRNIRDFTLSRKQTSK